MFMQKRSGQECHRPNTSYRNDAGVYSHTQLLAQNSNPGNGAGGTYVASCSLAALQKQYRNAVREHGVEPEVLDVDGDSSIFTAQWENRGGSIMSTAHPPRSGRAASDIGAPRMAT